MEDLEEEQDLIVIVDERFGVTRILFPDTKQYIEMPVSDIRSLTNDPFQAVKHAAWLGERRYVTTEKLEGHTCELYRIIMEGEVVMQEWFSPTLLFSVKIVTLGPEPRTVELTNILGRPLEDSLFAIPSDFEKIEEEPDTSETQQTRIIDITRSFVRKPPFQRLMFSEEVLRIPVKSNRILRITVVNQTDAEAVFLSVPLFEHQPIRDPAQYLLKVDRAGKGIEIFFEETEREADEIAVSAIQGTFVVTATYAEAEERHSVSEGNELRLSVNPEKDIGLRLVNLAQGKSRCWVTFYQKGTELNTDIIGPLNFRTFVLENENENFYRKWVSLLNADEVLIHVEQGEVLVSIRQP
jgi:hypothetical protein